MLDQRSRSVLAALALTLTTASCGSSPADVAGSYALNLTNGANGCMVMSWTEGESTTGVPLVITQDGESFTADVQGTAGLYLDLTAGAHQFTGTVSGTHLDGTLRGSGRAQGSCAYTINIDLSGELSGDVMTGDLTWYADTNDSPDCGMLATCENRQLFNGARPPSGT